MTRGKKPEKAIGKSLGIAVMRGAVWDVSTLSGFPADLIVFTPGQMIFIRVKRSRTRISEVREIESDFRPEIRELRTVPATAVVRMELWVLTPWGTWQYFRIAHDSVTEICRDGLPLAGKEKNPPGPDSPRTG